MERPSHINLRTSHTVTSRLASLGAAISLPLVLLWALAYGTSGEFIKTIETMTMVPVVEPAKPRVPPPSTPPLKTLPQITVEKPMITIAPDPSDTGTKIVVAPPQPARTDPPPSRGPDRALASITATHTAPPYPPLAQRLGQEGNVVLRLTVQSDGAVAKAEIVTSSGSSALDASAQEWIVAHWKYRPALDKGQPAPSQNRRDRDVQSERSTLKIIAGTSEGASSGGFWQLFRRLAKIIGSEPCSSSDENEAGVSKAGDISASVKARKRSSIAESEGNPGCNNRRDKHQSKKAQRSYSGPFPEQVC